MSAPPFFWGGYANQYPESGGGGWCFWLWRGVAFGSAEVEVEEGCVIVFFLNVSEYFTLSIMEHFKTTSENHDFGEKKYWFEDENCMVLGTEVLNQPSFDFRYFEGIQIFQVCKVGGFQTRSEFTTSACWSYKEGGVKTRLVDEYRLGPIDGERFVHRFVLCLHLLRESIARCFIPLCIAHILATNQSLPLVYHSFHHLSEDRVNKYESK